MDDNDCMPWWIVTISIPFNVRLKTNLKSLVCCVCRFLFCPSHHCVFPSLFFFALILLWHSIRLNFNLPICRCAFCINSIWSFYASFGILYSEFRREEYTNIYKFSGQYRHQWSHRTELLIGIERKAEQEQKPHMFSVYMNWNSI